MHLTTYFLTPFIVCSVIQQYSFLQFFILNLWFVKCIILFKKIIYFWLHRPSYTVAYGILDPQPGMEHKSLALAGRFLTIGPPEKSSIIL